MRMFYRSVEDGTYGDVERASKAPPYSHFLRNKTTNLWTTGMRADASLGNVSVMVFCLLEIALTGSRGKLLRNMRYYSDETFVPVIHSPSHFALYYPGTILQPAFAGFGLPTCRAPLASDWDKLEPRMYAGGRPVPPIRAVAQLRTRYARVAGS
eukprot:COSAG02_NODE_17276_length_1016_cov_0.950927_1_plen_153_part_10